mmetsp:Transcript_17959/g.27459  ORF Transcript_17959/g.27459 Transcript_17959/m.27459 type:complete len:80 (+) Transcript_17959:310-549(+)
MGRKPPYNQWSTRIQQNILERYQVQMERRLMGGTTTLRPQWTSMDTHTHRFTDPSQTIKMHESQESLGAFIAPDGSQEK